jgi:hypothetical protein
MQASVVYLGFIIQKSGSTTSWSHWCDIESDGCERGENTHGFLSYYARFIAHVMWLMWCNQFINWPKVMWYLSGHQNASLRLKKLKPNFDPNGDIIIECDAFNHDIHSLYREKVLVCASFQNTNGSQTTDDCVWFEERTTIISHTKINVEG